MANAAKGPATPAIAAEIDLGADVIGAAASRLGLRAPQAAAPTAAAEDDDLPAAEDAAETENTDTTTPEDTDAPEADAGDGAEDQGDPAAEDDVGEADAAEDQEEQEDAPAADEADDVDLRRLPPEQRRAVQKILDARIGKITAKTKAELETAQARTRELEAELAEAKTKGGGAPVVIEGVHPLLLAESEAPIEARLREIEQFEDWADEHANGYNVGEDADPAKPSYTAEQIRKHLRGLRKERETIVPQARHRLQQMKTVDQALRQLYPTVFDPKHEDYQHAQRLVQAMPAVKQFHDWRAVVVQQILGGRELRKLMAAKDPKNKPAPAALPPPRKKVPRAPGAGGPAKGGIAERLPGKPAASDAVKRYTKAPTREGLSQVALSFLEAPGTRRG